MILFIKGIKFSKTTCTCMNKLSDDVKLAKPSKSNTSCHATAMKQSSFILGYKAISKAFGAFFHKRKNSLCQETC